MSDEWFNSQLSPNYDPDDGANPEQVRGLREFYHKRLGLQETAAAFVQVYKGCDSFCSTSPQPLWGLLVEAFVGLPESEVSRLIELLKAIASLPNPFGQKGEFSIEDSTWHDLKGFGDEWADAYQPDHRDNLDTTDSAERRQLQVKYTKIANAEAQMVVEDMLPLLWGYEDVADALECNSARLDLEIPAVAQWMAIAGHRFYADAIKGEESPVLGLSRRNFRRGDSKMSVDRWVFWIERLEGMLGEDDVVACAAKAASDDMRALMVAGLSVGGTNE